MTTVAKRIATRDADLHVRFGLTAYRDPGNAFLTRTFDLTGDVVAFNSPLGEVQADGGGDTPEAPSAGLRAALDKPAWRGDDTVKLLFLVADAHRRCRTRKAPTTRWKRYAPRRGVNPIASSGLDDQGEYVYRQLAQITTGRFVFLTYGRTATPATPPPTTWTSIP